MEHRRTIDLPAIIVTIFLLILAASCVIKMITDDYNRYEKQITEQQETIEELSDISSSLFKVSLKCERDKSIYKYYLEKQSRLNSI